MIERSGLGDDTYVPPWLVNEPICMDIVHARLEFEITCFGAVQELLNKTGVCVCVCVCVLRGVGIMVGGGRHPWLMLKSFPWLWPRVI
jgi:FAE1/Type III polyketide synthase-like protein